MKADAGAFVEPPQPVYVAPSVLTKPAKSDMSNLPMTAVTTAATAQEVVERPPPRSLARGKYEVSPSTIWLTVAVAALLMLLYALVRARRAADRRKKELARMTALPRSREAST
ncbi:MAG: hypothetical protein ABI175_10645 [Polyangiales bacterium]